MSLKPKQNQNNYGFDQSDDSDFDESEPVKPTAPITKVSVKQTTIVQTSNAATGDLKRTTETELDEYDFVAHTKKAKVQKVVLQRTTLPKNAPTKVKPHSYTHKWGSDDEDDGVSDLKASSSSNGLQTSVSSSSTAIENRGAMRVVEKTTTIKSDIRVVRKAKQCLDQGEMKDFQDDLDYFMETLGSADASVNLKCLSMIKLTKRNASFEFRQYLRSKPAIFQKLLVYLKDTYESPALSICIAGFFYMLSRDSGQFPAKIVPLKLLLEYLKQDKVTTDAEYKSYQTQVWEIIQEWKKDCEKRRQRPIVFDLTDKNLTPGYLALVTLDYVMARAPSQNKRLQVELLNMGFLQTLVSKVDKIVLSLKLLRTPTEDLLLQHLSELEHSFRITENGIMLEKKNQAFVVGHRNGILLFSCEKYLDHFCQEISKYEVGTVVSKKLFDVLDLMFRLAMNASHSNEVCALKLGQIGNFLSNSLTVLSNYIPRFIEQERFIDFNLLLLGLLINLTEKSAANRRKVCNLKLQVYKLEEGKSVEEPDELSTLDFLTLLFVKHETMARTVDEELDSQLLEEGPEDEGGSGGEEEDGERLNRPNDMNEEEILNALNSAMKKATTHMQDSMMASYLGLLIGCLIQTDETLASKVCALIPTHNFAGILEQLERFKEFVELTKIVDLNCITNIIESLKLVDNSIKT